MADLTQSLYDVEERLKNRGVKARMVKVAQDGHGADPQAG